MNETMRHVRMCVCARILDQDISFLTKCPYKHATCGCTLYVGVMCDTNGDGHVRFDELIQAVKECHGVAKTMEVATGAGGASASIPLVMHKLRDFMSLNGGGVVHLQPNSHTFVTDFS